MPKDSRVLVSGPEHGPAPHPPVARAIRKAGIKHKEARVHVSNVAIVDSNGKPTRVGFRIEGGKKVRVAKTTGEVING